MNLAIQICFCGVVGENGRKLLPETFLGYQKGISPLGVLIILQLSRSVNSKMKTTLLQETEAGQIS